MLVFFISQKGKKRVVIFFKLIRVLANGIITVGSNI